MMKLTAVLGKFANKPKHIFRTRSFYMPISHLTPYI